MITTAFLTLVSWLMALAAAALPEWQLWPQTLLDGISYIAGAFARLDFILPIHELALLLTAYLNFSAAYVSAKLILKIINYLRGTGSGIDLK